jgi:hypothetical protein
MARGARFAGTEPGDLGPGDLGPGPGDLGPGDLGPGPGDLGPGDLGPGDLGAWRADHGERILAGDLVNETKGLGTQAPRSPAPPSADGGFGSVPWK